MRVSEAATEARSACLRATVAARAAVANGLPRITGMLASVGEGGAPGSGLTSGSSAGGSGWALAAMAAGPLDTAAGREKPETGCQV